MEGQMTTETMNAKDRLEAAVALEAVDRHPVFPIIVTAAARLYGITQGEAWRNHDAAREAMIWCFNEFGYDIASKPNFYYPMLPGKNLSAPVRNLIPGKQLPEDDLYQIEEKELFSRDDYDKIASLGWNDFWAEHYEKMSGKSLEKFTTMQSLSNQIYVADRDICAEKGVPIFLGAAVDSVLMAFSLSRTLTEFTKDLYEVPDKVEAAMNATADDLIANTIAVCRNNNQETAFIVLERGSGFYYRTEVFERFEFPYLQRYIDAFIAEGILPWLHLDTDWGLNLPYFKQLPKGKCVCDLDSTTDIFRAKEILGGHMCISGDVPAALLSIGAPEDVEAYCKKLIDEVGVGGGFMLTTGCECPVDVKPENLRAMVETGKNYKGKDTKTIAKRDAKAEADDITTQSAVQKTPAKSAAKVKEMPKGEISRSLGELEFDEVGDLIKKAIDGGEDPFAILNELRMGMDAVGERYSSGEYFLGELILSAEIFKEALELLEPHLGAKKDADSIGDVVIGTTRGDIHDIGKNIVSTLFKVAGFTVHDVGVDVEPKVFADKVAETDAKIVAMSALITPTFGTMKELVEILVERNLRDDRYVIIGGGPTTIKVKDYVGADGWTLDPRLGVDMCIDFIKGKS